VGDSLTIADILVFCSLISAYQLVLDAEFRKTTPNATQWFTHVANLPEIRKRAGAVKACHVGVKP
jgi:elongation factor 1-gamma